MTKQQLIELLNINEFLEIKISYEAPSPPKSFSPTNDDRRRGLSEWSNSSKTIVSIEMVAIEPLTIPIII